MAYVIGILLMAGVIIFMYFSHQSGFMAGLDQQLSGFAATIPSFVGTIAEIITWAGNWQVMVGLGLILAIIAFMRQGASSMVFVALSLVGLLVLIYGIKFGVGRPRPELAQLVEVAGYSFPSAHAAFSMGFYTFCAFYLSERHRSLWLTLAIILALLIGISRIILGVHYLSDVLAGWALGIGWLLILLLFFRRWFGDGPAYTGKISSLNFPY